MLAVELDGPDILRLERWLLADQLAFVPGLASLIGFPFRLPRSEWEPGCVAESETTAFRRSVGRVRSAKTGPSQTGRLNHHKGVYAWVGLLVLSP